MIHEKLKYFRQQFQQLLLVDAKSLPEREQILLRSAFDNLSNVESRARARHIQEEREMERRAAALAEERAVVYEPVSTYGVKGCPE
jgi:hypothetical protein